MNPTWSVSSWADDDARARTPHWKRAVARVDVATAMVLVQGNGSGWDVITWAELGPRRIARHRPRITRDDLLVGGFVIRLGKRRWPP